MRICFVAQFEEIMWGKMKETRSKGRTMGNQGVVGEEQGVKVMTA